MALPGELVGGDVFGGIVGGGVVIVGMVNVGGGMVGGGEVDGGLVGGGIVGGGLVLGMVGKSGKVGNVGKSGNPGRSEGAGLDVPGVPAGMVAGTEGSVVGGVWAFAPDIISPALPAATAPSTATRRFQTCTPTSPSAPSKGRPQPTTGAGTPGTYDGT